MFSSNRLKCPLFGNNEEEAKKLTFQKQTKIIENDFDIKKKKIFYYYLIFFRHNVFNFKYFACIYIKNVSVKL